MANNKKCLKEKCKHYSKGKLYNLKTEGYTGHCWIGVEHKIRLSGCQYFKPKRSVSNGK